MSVIGNVFWLIFGGTAFDNCLVFCRSDLLHHHHWNTRWVAVLQVCKNGVMAIRHGH